MVTVELLTDTDLTQGLKPEQIETLVALATSTHFEDGELILDPDDLNYGLNVVLSGDVKVLGVMGDLVGNVKRGNLLGEISFLDHKTRSAKAVATGPVHLAQFSSDLLFDLSTQDPLLEAQVLYNISLVICHKLRVATREIDASIV